jgi:hypothetical protein
VGIRLGSLHDVALQLRTSSFSFAFSYFARILCLGHLGLLPLLRETQRSVMMGPYYAVAFVRKFVLPSHLGGIKLDFVASGKSLAAADTEREDCTRLTLGRRLFHLLLRRGAWIHLAFVTLIIVGIARRAVLAFNGSSALTNRDAFQQAQPSDDPDAFDNYLVLFIVYVGFNPGWIVPIVQHYCALLWYIVCPPTNPPEPLKENMLELLDKGDGRQVYCSEQTACMTWMNEAPAILLIGYQVVILYLTKSW